MAFVAVTVIALVGLVAVAWLVRRPPAAATSPQAAPLVEPAAGVGGTPTPAS